MSEVYFLRPIGMDGPVKIGHSRAVRVRLEFYLTLAPWPLEIAARLPGGSELERRFHARFANQWTHHEWFSASPELTAAIDAINADSFDIEALPPPRLLPVQGRKKWPADMRRAASYRHRLYHLGWRGVVVPSEVMEAADRFAGRGRRCRVAPYDPAEALIIEAFLADHPRASDVPRRRAA